MEWIRPVGHLVLHALVPLLAARLFWPQRWRWAFAVMLLTMLVDLDHLLADPVYAPGRCSIGFHPLHRFPMLAVYAGLLAWPPLRVLGLGLCIHMLLDAFDCVVM